MLAASAIGIVRHFCLGLQRACDLRHAPFPVSLVAGSTQVPLPGTTSSVAREPRSVRYGPCVVLGSIRRSAKRAIALAPLSFFRAPPASANVPVCPLAIE